MVNRFAFHLAVALAAAVVATFLGGVAHALVIVPVWRQLASALPFAVFAAVPMSWAVVNSAGPQAAPITALCGLRVGAELWIALLPMTAFEAGLRLSHLHDGSSWLQAIAQAVIAFSTGFAIGWFARREGRAALAMAVAAVALAVALGGAVPITNSFRSVVFFAALLPVTAITGAFIGGFQGRFAKLNPPPDDVRLNP